MSRLLPTLSLALLTGALAASPALGQATIRATTTLHQDGTRSVTIVDPDKMTAEETVQDSRGRTLRKVTYLLDEQNQPIGSITFDAKGTVLYRTSYKRDGAGRIDEESVSSAEGALLRKRVYTYGVGNKVTNVVEYDAQGRVIQSGKRAKTAQPVRKR